MRDEDPDCLTVGDHFGDVQPLNSLPVYVKVSPDLQLLGLRIIINPSIIT